MLKKRFLEGPSAPPFFSVVCALLWATVASAQSVDRADLEACAAMSTDARKLACFESLLEEPEAPAVESAADESAAEESEMAPPQRAQQIVVPDDGSQDAASTVAAPATDAADTQLAATGSDVDSRVEATMEQGEVSASAATTAEPGLSSGQAAASSVRGATKSTASATLAMPAARRSADSAPGSPAVHPDPTDSASATAMLSDDFGREHVANQESEAEERVTATVTDVTSDYTKRLVFHFENGQVWRQQEARRFQYPKNRSFDVEIARGVFGDYQLRVGGEGRMTRIKRLQ